MRFRTAYLLVVLLHYYTQPLSAQRNRYRIWDATYGNLTCFSCSLDFRWMPFDINDTCLGIVEPVNKINLVRCGSTEIYCKEDFVVANGVLWTLTRQCTSTCFYGCRPRGFGIKQTTCTTCCNTHGCNSSPPPGLGMKFNSGRYKEIPVFSLMLAMLLVSV